MSFSSLYVGATGVVAHNTSMQVVANNLANVSTIGYKKADTQFGTLMSQQLGTSGTIYGSGAYSFSQIGKGVSVSDIRTVFEEGGLESTDSTTDIAIEGNGYFGLNNPFDNNNSLYYTRAGAFLFNNEAYLVNANGYRLQGYGVDRDTGEISTTITDVQLPYEDVVVDGSLTRLVRSDPRATTSFEMVNNLDHTAADLFSSYDNPFMAMVSAYSANQSNASSPFGGQLAGILVEHHLLRRRRQRPRRDRVFRSRGGMDHVQCRVGIHVLGIRHSHTGRIRRVCCLRDFRGRAGGSRRHGL